MTMLFTTAPPIRAIRAWAWDVPMRAPYRSAQRVTTTARNVLVQVTLDDGTIGWGESAPAQYVTGETQETVMETLLSVATTLTGTEPVTTALGLQRHAPLTHMPGARGALEMALLDAGARANQMPLFQLLGGAPTLPTVRTTDLSLPLLPPDEARARAAQAHRDGFTSLKIKVGGPDTEDDLQRVRAVAEAAPHARLRLDGNQGFTAEDAVRFADSLADLTLRLELFEQPTRAGDDDALGFVHARVPFPIFADESVHHEDDARRLVENGLCGGVVLKVAKSGLVETADIARAVHGAGGQCLFGCMMETRLAIGAALHLTFALGADTVGMLDLDGHLLVNDADLLDGGLTQEQDRLIVDRDQPGIGVAVRPIPTGKPRVALC